MSDGGLVVYNTNGSVQVDQNYAALAYSGKKGTIVATTLNTGGGYSSSVNIVANTPLIAVAGANGYAKTTGLYNYGNGTYSLGVVSTVANDSVSYWIYDTNVTPTPHSGFSVYDANGVLIFDAGYKILQEAAFITSTYTAPTSYTFTVGHTYAALEAGPPYSVLKSQTLVINAGFYNLVYNNLGFKTVTNGVQISNAVPLQGICFNPSFTPNNTAMSVLITDVTGY